MKGNKTRKPLFGNKPKDPKSLWSLDEMPMEVKRVFALQGLNQPIGLKRWKEIEEIIEKYPKYFPWETKYNTVPQEVHIAYSEEAYGMSFINQIKNNDIKEYAPATMEEFLEIGKNHEPKDFKTIWDKHYSKYGVEYRR
jgi:hypothetical protein